MLERGFSMGEHIQGIDRRCFIGAGAAALGAVALSSATRGAAFATPTAAEKKAEAAAVLDSLSAMQTKLGEASDNYVAALAEQEAAQAKMDEAQARIDEASEQISELQASLGSRARSMYRSGSLSFLDVLLGSADFRSFTSNWDLLSDLNESDAEMVQQTKDLKAEVEAQRAVYEEQERVAAEKAAEAAAVKAEAEAMVAEMQATYDALSAEAAELLAQEEAAREEAARQLALQNPQGATPSTGSSSGSSGSGSSSNTSTNTNNNNNNNKTQTVTGNVVVDRAYAQLGKPYVWAAAGPDSFDCSGLVSYCLTGRCYHAWTTRDIVNWTRVTEPVPGDICIKPTHTGVYIGGGQMIHAPQPGEVVKVASVQSTMWYVRY